MMEILVSVNIVLRFIISKCYLLLPLRLHDYKNLCLGILVKISVNSLWKRPNPLILTKVEKKELENLMTFFKFFYYIKH